MALIEEKNPDVAIVDYHLREFDGIALIEQIIECAPKTKIITLTQETDPFLLLQIIESGSHAILLKKFESVLKEVVYSIYFGGSYLQPELGYQIIDAAEERHRLDCLNQNERAYFNKISMGKDHTTIAKELNIKVSTVKKLLTNSKNKLNLKTKADLIKLYKKFYPAEQQEKIQSRFSKRIIDIKKTLEIFDGNKQHLNEMMLLFKKEIKASILNFDNAYQSGDLNRLYEISHRLHGGLKYIKAPRLEEAVSRFIESIKAENQEAIEQQFNQLSEEIDSVLIELQSLEI